MCWFVVLWNLSYIWGQNQDTGGLILNTVSLTMKIQSSFTRSLHTQDCVYSSTQFKQFLGLHRVVGAVLDTSHGLSATIQERQSLPQGTRNLVG